jgi:hypothetical protein
MDRFIRSHGAWLLVWIAARDEPIPKPYGTVSVECLGYACPIPAIIKKGMLTMSCFLSVGMKNLMYCLAAGERSQRALTHFQHIRDRVSKIPFCNATPAGGIRLSPAALPYVALNLYFSSNRTSRRRDKSSTKAQIPQLHHRALTKIPPASSCAINSVFPRRCKLAPGRATARQQEPFFLPAVVIL